MLARAIACVDDRDRAHGGGPPGGALLVVAKDDHVGVAADDADRVLQGLALRRGGELARIVRAHGLPAQAQHRRLERKPGARGGLVEKRRHHLSGEPSHEPVRLALDLFRAREQLFEQRSRELLTLDDVSESRRDGHEKISFPGSQART